MDVRPEHSKNAQSPIEMTELGMITDFRLLQYANTLSPIDVTELGMVTDVMSEQSEKA
jgi:hypothetical protein